MYIPTLPQGPVFDVKTGYWTPDYRLFFDTLIQVLRQAAGDEGFQIPNQNSANIAIIEPNANIGTLIFNSSIVNGGSTDAPNGQLQVKLADGTFHDIVNT